MKFSKNAISGEDFRKKIAYTILHTISSGADDFLSTDTPTDAHTHLLGHLHEEFKQAI